MSKDFINKLELLGNGIYEGIIKPNPTDETKEAAAVALKGIIDILQTA